MKILLLSSASFKTGKTGDATQGRETVQALRRQGNDVRVVCVSYCPLKFETPEGTPLSQNDLVEYVSAADVVHFLPANPILLRYWRSMPRRPVLASSIFWEGWERVVVALKNIQPMRAKIHGAVSHLRTIAVPRDYRGVDVFLPNSQREGECVLKYLKHSKDATYFAVPNGFIPPDKAWLDALERPDCVPRDEYVVVPGAFAWRKNQRSLIEALRGTPYHVVFLGGGMQGNQGRYFDECKKAANERMRFLGHIANDSELYWAILRHARAACLASDCETPGIAMIEAAYAGARPVITKHGGTSEYYGFDGEYLEPCSQTSIRTAVENGWRRGRLTEEQSRRYARFTWDYCAELTVQAYNLAIAKCKAAVQPE